MKKVLAVLLSIGFILCASDSISAQQKSVKKTPIDTTSMKLKVPRKQIRKQKEQIKKTEKQEPRLRDPILWQDNQPLLIKEKDSLQNKTK
jgi:hypothetical protein